MAMKTNILGNLGLGLVFSILTLGAAAETLDKSNPLICVSVETFDCQPGSHCVKGVAEDIDAPQFIRLDFERGVAHTTWATGEERTAKIQTTLQGERQLILQGVQRGLGWNMTIARQDGAMALTVAGGEMAFVIFGACTKL